MLKVGGEGAAEAWSPRSRAVGGQVGEEARPGEPEAWAQLVQDGLGCQSALVWTLHCVWLPHCGKEFGFFSP